jgi:ankyrin repeat protein
VLALLDEETVDLAAVDNLGMTATMWASRSGHDVVAGYLRNACM